MKEELEKIWNEYLAEECAAINTEEERVLIRKAGERRKTASELLTAEQSNAIEKYVEVLYDIQSFCIKKAFFKGCEFAMSFLFELETWGKK